MSSNLNPKQLEASLHKDGPLMILAGAGAGKTKTITHRIVNLIKSGVAPHNILAVTFTNKAAKEMRERTMKLIAEDEELNRPISLNEAPFVSTFHSLGVRIIKENSERLGLKRHFKIYDRDESKKAVKDAVVASSLDPKQFEPGKILSIISKEKGNNISYKTFADEAGSSYTKKIVAEIWGRYEETLRKEGALDFDDLLLKTVGLLKIPEIKERYQNTWKYIHIDEYQDTNAVQYEITRLLGEKHRNVCVIGDEDQLIYSWRGADIENILNFEHDYTDAKVIILEQNYRSSGNILKAANSIIKKNKKRKEKKMFTEKGEGEKIKLYYAFDENDEARFVAKTVEEILQKEKDPFIAVLYRANFQSRAIEQMFLSYDVPYDVLGTKFFDRKEIKDILAYLRLALNNDSISDMKRIINIPARGIGKTTLIKIVAGQENELPPKTALAVANFKKLIQKIGEEISARKPSELVKFIIKESGLEEVLMNGKDEDKERLDNLKEFVSFAVKYDHMEYGEGIEKLIEDASLASDQDEMKDKEEGGAKTKLMTIHASKGLEFDYVFVTGLEDGLFPSKREGEKVDEEEERRLMYVAVTRAQKKAILTTASIRTIFGEKRIGVPSEFIGDIDEEQIEQEEEKRPKREYLIDF